MNCATMQANKTRRCMKFSMFWGRLIFSILLFWQQMILFLCSHQGAKLNINDERSDLGEINTIFNRSKYCWYITSFLDCMLFYYISLYFQQRYFFLQRTKTKISSRSSLMNGFNWNQIKFCWCNDLSILEVY